MLLIREIAGNLYFLILVKNLVIVPDETIIAQTRNWITAVVIGCNFCPFAAGVVRRNSIYYEVLQPAGLTSCLEALTGLFHKLDNEPAIETLFLVIPDAFESFDSYLELVGLSEKILKDQGYEGIYQIASFHPHYLFAGSGSEDAANYTNRSPYPMLHILREESVTRAIENYPGTENIPNRNIAFARAKGQVFMESLKNSSFTGQE